MNQLKSIIMIFLAASLWGTISIYVKQLSSLGLTSMEIVAIRCFWAFISLLIILLFFFKDSLKLEKLSDIKYFIGTGIISIVFFNYCYFQTITNLNISIAVILLYTAPIFVSIFSYILFKERLSKMKLFFVFLTFIGCAMIAGFSISSLNISFFTLLIGLGSGVGYALYTIFSRYALQKYKPLLITFYTFFVATIFLFISLQLWNKFSIIFSGEVLLYGMALGLFPTVCAYLLYTKGLEQVENTKAAVISTIEPIVATVVAVSIFQEKLSMLQVMGSIVIIVSVLMINKKENVRQPQEIV